jgi:spermidine/putrescine-binding protein
MVAKLAWGWQLLRGKRQRKKTRGTGMKTKAVILKAAVVVLALSGCTPYMETGSEMKAVEVGGYRVYTQFQTADKTMWAGRFDNLVTAAPGPVATRNLVRRAIEKESGCEIVDDTFTYDVRTMTGFGKVACT